jgi:hypothetical protein
MARAYVMSRWQKMLRTVEEAMSSVIVWQGDLPPPMKASIQNRPRRRPYPEVVDSDTALGKRSAGDT